MEALLRDYVDKVNSRANGQDFFSLSYSKQLELLQMTREALFTADELAIRKTLYLNLLRLFASLKGS